MFKTIFHRTLLLFVSTLLTFSTMSRPLFAQNQSMIEGFWTYCVAQAINDTRVPRTDLHKFSEDQIAQLGRNLGWSDLPEAIWVSSSGYWLIIDSKIDEPRLCMAVSLNDPVTKNVTEWNEKISSDDSFRSRGKASLRENRSQGWATTPVDRGFVQVSLRNRLYRADPFASMALLVAVRVGLSPASCELFPSRCD